MKKYLIAISVFLSSGLIYTSFGAANTYSLKHTECFTSKSGTEKTSLVETQKRTTYYSNVKEVTVDELGNKINGYCVEVSESLTGTDEASIINDAKLKDTEKIGFLFKDGLISSTKICRVTKEDCSAMIKTAWIPTALAVAAPIDNFESYAVAGLSGDNGGTGWGGAYATCDVAWTVVSTPTFTGTRSINANGDNKSCLRPFGSSNNVDNVVYEVWARSAGTDARIKYTVYAAADGLSTGMQFIFDKLGSNIQALNNVTLDNVATYSANTWFRIDMKATSYTGKTWQIATADCSVDCTNPGTYSANKTFGNNIGAASDQVIFSHEDTATNGYFDDIGPAAAVVNPVKVPDVIFID